jgi:hypothetical protein
MVTKEDRQVLREAARTALLATCKKTSDRDVLSTRGWELQTSKSYRRIGCHGDGDVLYATVHHRDGQPDLTAPSGVLKYIVAAQPRVVMELLDQLDELERKLCDAQVLIQRLEKVTP